MDVTEKIFLVEKHKFKRGKGGRFVKVRRRFHEESGESLALLRGLAVGYAAQRKEDFLIVRVLAEVSRPAGNGINTENTESTERGLEEALTQRREEREGKE